MGTEVLRPQDCLVQRVRVAPAIFHRRKNYYGTGNPKPNSNSTRKQTVRSEHRKRSPEPTMSKRSASADDLRSKPLNNNLVMGQVTILRRGESIDTIIKAKQVPAQSNGVEMMIMGTGRLGPDPGMVPKQIRLSSNRESDCGGFPLDIYAGSAFFMSPSPSSLPLPSFFNKKEGAKYVDDSATRDLRRLLRLE